MFANQVLQALPRARRSAVLCATLALFPFAAFAAPLVVKATNAQIDQDVMYPGQLLTLSYSIVGPGANVTGGLIDVKIELVKDSTIAKTITIPAGETGAVPGANTLKIPVSQLPEGGPYTVRVTPTGGSVSGTDYIKVSNPNDPNMQFVGARGVDVNNVTGHPALGRIYVTEGAGGVAKDRATKDGVYVLNPDLTPAFPTPKATSADIGALGPWTTSTHSPFRVYVAPNGEVYLTDAADAHPMVMRADADLSTFAPVFDFTGLTFATNGLAKDAGGVEVFGDVTAAWVEGSGADRKIYLAIQEVAPDSSIHRFDVPEGATPSPQPTTVVTSGYTETQWYTDFVKDAAGSYYIVNQQNTTMPAQKFDADGIPDSVLPASDPATTYFGIAIDEARDTILLATNDGRILKTTRAFNSVTPLITGLGKEVRDVAMDRDGWIYTVNTTDGTLSVFAPPGTYNVTSVSANADKTLTVAGLPLSGDISPVGPSGLYLGRNGQRYGDGKVDANDAIYNLRVFAGLNTLP